MCALLKLLYLRLRKRLSTFWLENCDCNNRWQHTLEIIWLKLMRFAFQSFWCYCYFIEMCKCFQNVCFHSSILRFDFTWKFTVECTLSLQKWSKIHSTRGIGLVNWTSGHVFIILMSNINWALKTLHKHGINCFKFNLKSMWAWRAREYDQPWTPYLKCIHQLDKRWTCNWRNKSWKFSLIYLLMINFIFTI